jgi:hypothetical protein
MVHGPLPPPLGGGRLFSPGEGIPQARELTTPN